MQVCPGCLFWSLRQLTALEALEFRQPTVCYEEVRLLRADFLPPCLYAALM